jgi:hypothetical protein
MRAINTTIYYKKLILKCLIFGLFTSHYMFQSAEITIWWSWTKTVFFKHSTTHKVHRKKATWQPILKLSNLYRKLSYIYTYLCLDTYSNPIWHKNHSHLKYHVFRMSTNSITHQTNNSCAKNIKIYKAQLTYTTQQLVPYKNHFPHFYTKIIIVI